MHCRFGPFYSSLVMHYRIIVCLLWLLPSVTFAQWQPDQLLSIGIGANSYRGDLGPGFQQWDPSFYAALRLNQKQRLNGSFQLNIGTVSGQNPEAVFVESNAIPNRHFSTSIISAQFSLNFNFIKTEHFTLSIAQGIGLLRYNPRDEFGNALQDFSNTRASNETYGNIAVVLPIELELIYLLKNGYGVSLRSGIMNPMTDYIDNIAALGTGGNFDNVFTTRFSVQIPLSLQKGQAEKRLQ